MGVAVGVLGGDFGGVGDQREGGQDVGELGLGQAVEVADYAIRFFEVIRKLSPEMQPWFYAE